MKGRVSFSDALLEGMSEEKKAKIAKAKEVFPTLAAKSYCITLKERPDRMKETGKRFEAVGLNYVQFHCVDRHPQGGTVGCYDSHRTLIQRSYDEGLEYLMMFEDDVCFYEDWEEVVLDLKEFIDAKEVSFNILFLGCGPSWIGKKTTPKIWLLKACLTHAYIISRQGMKAFLDKDDFFMKGMTSGSSVGHDVLTNFCIPHMYGHSSFSSVQQDVELGSDNVWFPNLPRLYGNWLQQTVMPRIGRSTFFFMSSDFYVNSYFNQHYAMGFSRLGVCDDGVVRLKTAPLLEFSIFSFLLMTTWPYPRGVWGIFADLIIPFWAKVLTGQKPVLREPDEEEEDPAEADPSQ